MGGKGAFTYGGTNECKTDGFAFGCETNRTTGVIAVNDGASLKARRFGSQAATMKEGTDITLSLNGGVLCPLLYAGWANIRPGDAGFLTQRDGIVRPANADFLQSVFLQAMVTRVPGHEHVLPVTFPGLIDAAVRICLAVHGLKAGTS